MVECEEFVEEVSGIFIGQLYIVKFVSDLGYVI